jgi:hypothetical protein
MKEHTLEDLKEIMDWAESEWFSLTYNYYPDYTKEARDAGRRYSIAERIYEDKLEEIKNG